MSKFFKETYRTQEWAAGEASKHLDAEKLLESLKGAETVGGEAAQTRLDRCRRISLPRGGEYPLISSPEHSATAAVEAYRTLRTRMLRLASSAGIRSVAVSSGTPGEGKTLTVLNLGLSCAQLRNHRVLVVDGDLRTRGLTRLFGSVTTPGLTEVLTGKATPEQAVLATEQPNLYVMTAGATHASPPELFAHKNWKEFIGWCNESFKLVLLDSPPMLPLADFELITAGCDGVLIVVRALRTPRGFLQKAASIIEPRKILGVVFNATEYGTKSRYHYHYLYQARNGDAK